MPLGLNNFDRSNLFLGPIEGVGPENLGFLGPKWHSLWSLPFRGPPLPMALVMALPTSKL
jgi:hypothetical protein